MKKKILKEHFYWVVLCKTFTNEKGPEERERERDINEITFDINVDIRHGGMAWTLCDYEYMERHFNSIHGLVDRCTYVGNDYEPFVRLFVLLVLRVWWDVDALISKTVWCDKRRTKCDFSKQNICKEKKKFNWMDCRLEVKNYIESSIYMEQTFTKHATNTYSVFKYLL